jgi:hypothetical protein
MERDVRRGRDQWKGCYSFKDISCDSSATTPKRNGGLKMGHTYYYYYEVDGSTETYDATMPSTTACPYLPGQTLNTLSVPEERSSRYRSASLTSIRQDNFRTMNPEAKYITPRPAPQAPGDLRSPRHQRLGSAPAHIRNNSASSSRSPSPAPVWKRLFGRKMSVDIDRGRSLERCDDNYLDFEPLQALPESRSSTPSDGTRTRDISPDSLCRFLTSGDHSSRPSSSLENRPALVIPEDIVEENEDDDNFASSAVSEIQQFPTCLSPPPIRRSSSNEAVGNSSTHTLVAPPAPPRRSSEGDTPELPVSPLSPRSNYRLGVTCISIPPSVVDTPNSPLSPLDELPSYDSTEEDDDDAMPLPRAPIPSSRRYGFMGYSLPQQLEGKLSMYQNNPIAMPNSPPFLARGDSANLLGTSIDTGLDDFASELGWAVDSISNKHA